jgi:hypothetical protein
MISHILCADKRYAKGFLIKEAFMSSVPARARTVDPLIKSQLLYQLSYEDFLQNCNGQQI